jgi:hypothetical protein
LFGLRLIKAVDTKYGEVDVVELTHLPTGRRVMLIDELDDGAVAAEICEPFYCEFHNISIHELRMIGPLVADALRDSGFEWPGIMAGTPEFEVEILHRTKR